MCLMNVTKSNTFGKNLESMSDTSDLSSTIRHELESILEGLGSDEKTTMLKKKIVVAIADLSSTVEGIKDYREALDSFSDNLEKIIKDWDSNDAAGCNEQLEN
jgi:hypothetical protein